MKYPDILREHSTAKLIREHYNIIMTDLTKKLMLRALRQYYSSINLYRNSL